MRCFSLSLSHTHTVNAIAMYSNHFTESVLCLPCSRLIPTASTAQYQEPFKAPPSHSRLREGPHKPLKNTYAGKMRGPFGPLGSRMLMCFTHAAETCDDHASLHCTLTIIDHPATLTTVQCHTHTTCGAMSLRGASEYVARNDDGDRKSQYGIRRGSMEHRPASGSLG